MQITTMEMDPRIAAIHYKDYRKRCRVHFAARLAQANKDVVEGGKQFRAGRIAKSILEKEDETLMESYRVMAQGNALALPSKLMPSRLAGPPTESSMLLRPWVEMFPFAPAPRPMVVLRRHSVPVLS